MARSRRTPRVLILSMPLGAFQPPKPENRIFRRYALGGDACLYGRRERRCSRPALGTKGPVAATITIWHYFKSAKCYTRSLANPTKVGMLFLKRQFSKVCVDSFGGGTRLWNRRTAALFSIRSVIESYHLGSE